MPAMSAPHYLFLTTSTREPGHLGNTEWLARQAAAALPAGTEQTWHHLARMQLPPFVDQRHTTGTYAPPEGDMKTLLDATLAASHIVWVAPVYWYSIPSPLKTYLDHWSAWMRVPGLDFKDAMGRKTLSLITTSGAIATTALVARADPSARAAAIAAGLSRFAGRELTTDEAVYASESATGHRNRALAHLLRSYRLIDGDPHDVVEARLSDGLGMHVFDEHEAIAAPRVAIVRDHAGGVRVTLDGELSFSGAERVLAQLRGIHVDIDAIPLTVDLRGVTQMHPAALAVVRQQVAALGGTVEIED